MQVNAKVYTLETDNAKLAVKALGAELTSWQPAKKQEWLHQSDHVWQGQALAFSVCRWLTRTELYLQA